MHKRSSKLTKDKSQKEVFTFDNDTGKNYTQKDYLRVPQQEEIIARRIQNFVEHISSTNLESEKFTQSHFNTNSTHTKDGKFSYVTPQTESIGACSSVDYNIQLELDDLSTMIPESLFQTISNDFTQMQQLQSQTTLKSEEVIMITKRIRTCMLPSLTQLEDTVLRTPQHDYHSRFSIPKYLVSLLSEASSSYIASVNELSASITQLIEYLENICQTFEKMDQGDEKNFDETSHQIVLSQIENLISQLLRKREVLHQKISSHRAFIDRVLSSSSRVIQLQSQSVSSRMTVRNPLQRLNDFSVKSSDSLEVECRILERLLRRAPNEISWEEESQSLNNLN